MFIFIIKDIRFYVSILKMLHFPPVSKFLFFASWQAGKNKIREIWSISNVSNIIIQKDDNS